MTEIYIYAFSRCVYPKRLTGQAIHFCQYVCSLGIEPTTFALLRDGGIFLQNNNDFLCQH